MPDSNLRASLRPQGARKYAPYPQGLLLTGHGGKPVFAGKTFSLGEAAALKPAKQPLDGLAMATLAARLMEDKKGRDITVLDVQAVSSLADYFIIGTADSRPQIRAISESIRHEFAKLGILPIAPPTRYAPQGAEGWQLLDFGDVIVHVLSPEDREFYQLEAFWDHADLVERDVWKAA